MPYKGRLSVHVVRYPAPRNKAGRATTVAITVFVYGTEGICSSRWCGDHVRENREIIVISSFV